MRVLIVHAHPEPQSFSSSMSRTAVRVLEEQGHEVAVSDLYAMGFNPVASAGDFGQRADPDYLVYALEQRQGHQSGTLAPDIAAEIEKVVACDLLILNFPIFWFSTPAILKGWIDRVFVSGQFYGGKRFYDQGGMRGRKAWVTATLGGREHMFGPNAIHGELTDMLRPLLRGTLAYTGFEVLEPFFGYHIPYLKPEARDAIMAAFAQEVAGLAQRPALRFPRLEDFDDRLYPLAAAAS
jgi:NAD(P)H dehydrogenase (quinone)